jgi:hypothetical protein
MLLEPIDRLGLGQLVDAWDEAVVRDGAVDGFCSRSAWQLSYHDAFASERTLWLARESDDWVILAEQRRPDRLSVLEPLENMWGFASPLLGPGAAELLARSLLEAPMPVLLLGLPIDRDRLAPLASALGGRFAGRSLASTTRYVASLGAGLDGWLGRRTSRFRRNLRAVMRRVSAAGIHFRRLPHPAMGGLDALYSDVLEVERRSWKSVSGNGADKEPMRSFYAFMWPGLAERRQLKILFAELDGRAIGYLYGGLIDGAFRGLQFSFDHTMRDLGLGNALQYEMLRWLCEDAAHSYDLGARSEYKGRWAEPGLETFGLLLQPRAAG